MKIANIITCIRALCGIVLIFCIPFSQGFYLIYIIGGLSDVLDGLAARLLNAESEAGAKLDTAADLIFTVVLLIKILNAVYVPTWLIIWIICIAIIKCITIIRGLIAGRTFVAEHTVLNKVCGVLLFAIPLCIGRFPWQPVAILVILTCVIATAAAIQEGHYIRFEKTRKSDVK